MNTLRFRTHTVFGLLRMFVFAAVPLVFVTGCTVSQYLEITGRQSAETDIDIELEREFSTYLLDLSGVLGAADADASPFDLGALADIIESEPGATLLGGALPHPGRLVLSVDIEDIERVLTEGPHRIEGLIRHERDGNERVLTVRLNRRRLEQMSQLAPVAEQSAVNFLLPPAGMNAEEYVEYLAWAMEEYAVDRPIDDVIREARLTVRIAVPGRITSVTGGRRVDGANQSSEAEFSERVVHLMTTDETTSWSVRYRSEN